MSTRLAAFVYRWRLPLTALIFAGAILAIPRANITQIDNDITAWFSREDSRHYRFLVTFPTSG